MSDTKTIGEANGTILTLAAGPDIEIEDLKAFIHPAEEGGYWAEVPALPGCLTEGETLDEVIENLNDAIQGWLSVQTLESLKANGVPFTVTSPEAEGPARLPRIRTFEIAA